MQHNIISVTITSMLLDVIHYIQYQALPDRTNTQFCTAELQLIFHTRRHVLRLDKIKPVR